MNKLGISLGVYLLFSNQACFVFMETRVCVMRSGMGLFPDNNNVKEAIILHHWNKIIQ